MGKVKVRTLGDESLENKQKNESRLASKAKRAKKKAEEKKSVKGVKGGERIVAVGPSEEELARIEVSKNEMEKAKTPKTEKAAKKKEIKKTKSSRSKQYQTIAKLVNKDKAYSLKEALELLKNITRGKFDETVELHVNTTATGVSGNVVLPHGTGKNIRVAIANDEIIKEVEKGKISFDVLLAEPQMMPKLARVAKYLGPRGLMPNPKSGTISNDPAKLALSFEKGQINFKTEAKTPIIHLRVGKISFGEKKLEENINSLIDAIKKSNIQKAVLKSTMSPGIKIQL